MIDLLSHQFFRSANDRAQKASLAARRFDGRGHFGVGDSSQPSTARWGEQHPVKT